MTHTRFGHLALAAVALSGMLGAGCKSTQASGQESSTEPGPHVLVGSPSANPEGVAEPAPAAPAESAPVIDNPLADAGVCAPTEPIKSTDPCKVSTDCAPSALCHAPSCVDKAKAPVPPDGGAVCTMSLVCRTTDVGKCDCVDGVCALVAK